ncbi:MAG: glycosyltransferase family 9 protein [Phycisphaerales bacterium]|nr:glycosyltransferase family 9 protein [Phycisphaerales bacterium]MCB9864324.1 glycosyltransferase family 9 protein [Phycisphaerales bacterium]
MFQPGQMVLRSATEWAAQLRREAPGVPALVPSRRQRRRLLALCLGGIGDTVLAFAALRDLRKACPDDHITALAMWPQAAELLEDLGLFDDVLQHNFQRDRSWRSGHKALSLCLAGYDASILTFPTNRFEYNVLSYLIGARRRWGHSYVRGGDAANLRFLLTDRVAQQLGRHVVDENRELIRAFSGTAIETPADIRLGPLDPSYHSHAQRMFAHLDRPLVGIHAGCSTYKGHAVRRWPIERFGRLCRRMESQGYQPVVFGGPEEQPIRIAIQSECPQVFFAHGESIRQTAALIARCSAFVSNDSGLSHIAAAMNVPVVMVVGPTDPRGIGPYPGHGVAVASTLACSPCFQVSRSPLRCSHRITSACMQEISVDRVWSALIDVLADRQVLMRSRDILRWRAGNNHNTRTLRLPVLTSASCAMEEK